ncbi:glycosyl transferase [Candidatus Roizmanbacteria bacterium CG07_land_8_20_14_0_80_34_15]|uniref:Glycosyl transferase n=1 Tax=Candidatus Roizmanbacteria bacterium CG07_land_8_20_14_0_80_34_15 TaxID=1974849 RepID=A0A2M6YV36_9BACT|nr:MAG: glycosyl transferase [Candidatus Roizmanbacteria bacterium CG07_land_8_20_14_0_80_34_15]
MKISIIVPFYNEENYIGNAIDRIISSDTLGFKKEVILVDDGSTDESVKKIKRIINNKKFNNITFDLIQNNKNEGKGSSLKKGFLKSTGDIVLVQDADLEYNPEDYPHLLEPFMKNNADIVYGSRLISNRPHRVLYFWHYVGNSFLTIFSNIFTNLNLTDMETGYKVFKGKILRNIAINLISERFGFEPEITAKISNIKDIRIFEVGITYQGRTYAEGKKVGWTDGLKAIGEIIKFNLFNKK